MLIAVDGPEGVGKTTLLDKIKSLHPGTTYRIHHDTDLAYSAVIGAELALMETAPHALFLVDRWWLTNLAYHGLFGQPRLQDEDPAEVERVYGGRADRMGIRVLLLATPDILKQRRERRGKTSAINAPPSKEEEAYKQASWRTNWNQRYMAGEGDCERLAERLLAVAYSRYWQDRKQRSLGEYNATD